MLKLVPFSDDQYAAITFPFFDFNDDGVITPVEFQETIQQLLGNKYINLPEEEYIEKINHHDSDCKLTNYFSSQI